MHLWVFLVCCQVVSEDEKRRMFHAVRILREKCKLLLTAQYTTVSTWSFPDPQTFLPRTCHGPFSRLPKQHVTKWYVSSRTSSKIYCLQCGIYKPHPSIHLLEPQSVDISFHKGQMLASYIPSPLPHPLLLGVWITHTASDDSCGGGLWTRLDKCCVRPGNKATILPLASFPSSQRAWDKITLL